MQVYYVLLPILSNYGYSSIWRTFVKLASSLQTNVFCIHTHMQMLTESYNNTLPLTALFSNHELYHILAWYFYLQCMCQCVKKLCLDWIKIIRSFIKSHRYGLSENRNDECNNLRIYWDPVTNCKQIREFLHKNDNSSTTLIGSACACRCVKLEQNNTISTTKLIDATSVLLTMHPWHLVLCLSLFFRHYFVGIFSCY